MNAFKVRCIEPKECKDVTKDAILRSLRYHFGYKFEVIELTPAKAELPEEMPVSNSDDTLYRVFAKEINKIIKYLKQKERGL